MATKPLSITINEKIYDKLEKIAQETHRKKSYFVNEAMISYFEEIEDYEIARTRRGGESIPISEAKRHLDV